MITTTVFWRVAVPAVLAAALTLAMLITFASPAEAADPYYVLGPCRYDPDLIAPITYRFYGVEDRYETAFKDGEAKWDSTSAPGYFVETSGSSPEIRVYDRFVDMVDWNAMMMGSCPSNTGLWNGNAVSITFNRQKMDGHGSVSKKNTAMHEIGHAYGLSHVSAGCRLMRRDRITVNTCGLSLPTSDDVDGVIARFEYP